MRIPKTAVERAIRNVESGIYSEAVKIYELHRSTKARIRDDESSQRAAIREIEGALRKAIAEEFKAYPARER